MLTTGCTGAFEVTTTGDLVGTGTATGTFVVVVTTGAKEGVLGADKMETSAQFQKFSEAKPHDNEESGQLLDD